MGQKSQQDALYLRFFTKKLLLSCHFCQKNVHSLKNTLFSRAYLVRKTSIFSKTLCSHVNFFKIFIKNPLLPCLYLVKKNINSVKALLYFWPKSQQDALFSDFSSKNNCFHADILSKKRLFSQKHNALISIFCQKAYILSKTLC